MDNLIITPGGDRIRIMGDDVAARLLSIDHLESTLRKMDQPDIAYWMQKTRDEDLRALAHDYEEQQRVAALAPRPLHESSIEDAA